MRAFATEEATQPQTLCQILVLTRYKIAITYFFGILTPEINKKIIF